MDVLEGYLRLYGRPESLYLDRHSTYKANREADLDELLKGQEAQTQFARAAQELGIRIIHAYSPQAKGRVERLFGTLQDRLVKELRLAGIRTREEANRFLEDYWPGFNQQFSKPAREARDAHQPLPKRIDLREVFCLKGTRTINSGYLVRWRSRVLAVQKPTLSLRRRTVQILEHQDGEIILRFEKRDLEYRLVEPGSRVPKLARSPRPEKPKTGKYIPPPDHPWRRSNGMFHRAVAQGRF
jgi:hypothetical protein